MNLLTQLVRSIPQYPVRVGLSLLFAVCATGASVGLMGSSAYLLSRAAEMPPVLYLLVIITSVRAFGISRAVFRYVERLVSHDLALRMQSALRLRSYDRLSRTSWLGRHRGDLLVRVITDVEAVMDLVVRVALPFASSAIVAIAAGTIITVFNPISGVALLVSAVLAGAVVPWLARLASRRADVTLAPARGELGEQAHEMARAATDLTAYGAGRTHLDRLMVLDTRLRRAEERTTAVRALADGAQVLAAAVAILVALVVGGRAVVDGDLHRTLLAVLVLTPLALHEALASLAEAAQTATRAGAALARVSEVLDADQVGVGDRELAEPVENPGLSAETVTLGWPGHDPVLHDVSLRVEPGERVAVTGRSGVGKTTLAATVLGMIPPVAGTVEARGRVGYLAQDAHVFDTTVAENVRIGNREATDEQITEALARAGLSLAPSRMVGEHGGRLSGGEGRRLVLARLLVGDFQVYVLDEPTEHLDAETAEALMADVWQATAGAPVLVITHDPLVVEACDRVVHLTPAPVEPVPHAD
ncbi:MAG: thiol reductant ABC exporter subunit CydC [Propionibacterium sp.]|nr:thiol reductant ABC exporter subunit CydC [Propionibacterium sp.]